MVKCDFCGKEIGNMPFQCRRCHSNFCWEHRFPEEHNCENFKKGNIFKNLSSDKKQHTKHHKKRNTRIPQEIIYGNEDFFPPVKHDGDTKQNNNIIVFVLCIILTLLVCGFILMMHPSLDQLREIEYNRDEHTDNIESQNISESPKDYIEPLPVIETHVVSVEPKIVSASIEQIVKNPEKYMNKSLKTTATLVIPFTYPPPTIKWKYSLLDEQGYNFPVKLTQEKRHFYTDHKYTVNGNIVKEKYCICQKRHPEILNNLAKNNIDNSLGQIMNWECPIGYWQIVDEWRDIGYSEKKQLASSCLKEVINYNCSFEYMIYGNSQNIEELKISFREEYRCNPETTESFYYFDAQDMTKIS